MVLVVVIGVGVGAHGGNDDDEYGPEEGGGAVKRARSYSGSSKVGDMQTPLHDPSTNNTTTAQHTNPTFAQKDERENFVTV